MEMNKALKMLEALAEKLGTTVEALWPCAVRHTLYTAVGMLVGSWLVFTGFVLWLYLNMDKVVWADGYGEGPTQKCFAIVGCVIFFIVASFVTAAAVPDIVEPTGALTKEVLGKVGSSGS